MNKYSLLLIDDDFNVLAALKRIFIAHGHKITTAKSYREFKKNFSKDNFDAVLCDIALPDKSGLDILSEIKTADNETAVIMITGFATVENSIKAIKEGANGFLVKPFNSIEYVYNTVEDIIRKQKAVIENISLKRLNKLKDELISLISHEFRTPITIIKGFFEMLPENIKNEWEFYPEITNQIKRLTYLISQVETVASIYEYKMLYKEFNLKFLIDEILDSYTEDIAKLNLKVIKKIKVEKFFGDKYIFFLLLDNLISNSIKFNISDGEIIIRVESQDDFEFCIENTCKTIEAEKVNVIFEIFKQGEDYLTRSSEGLGLGLYIVNEILNLFHTRLAMEQTDRKIKFYFNIPISQ